MAEKELLELQKRAKSTYEKCGDSIGSLKGFISDLTVIFGCITENADTAKAKQSLVYFRFLQCMLNLKELAFLLVAAHYISCAQILRYCLESIVQALYLDQQHPSFSLENKLCVLTEISDKSAYFIARLIDRLPNGSSKRIRRIYKELSLTAHPTHLDFPTVEELTKNLTSRESRIDCMELEHAIEMTHQTFDVIFYLVLHNFPRARQAVCENQDVGGIVKKQNLSLLQGLVSVK